MNVKRGAYWVLVCTSCSWKMYRSLFSDSLLTSSLPLSSILYLNNTLFKANWRPRENDSPLLPENCASSEGCSFSWRTGSPSLPWERKDHSEKRAPSYLCCSHAQTHTGMCSDARRDAETHTHTHTLILTDTLQRMPALFLAWKNTSGL